MLVVLPFKMLVTLMIVLLICSLGGLILIKRKKKISHIIWPIKPKIEIDWERLGFTHYKRVDPLLIDETHELTLVEQTYIIKGNDAQYILRYKGKNVSDDISRFFRDGVVGDSPMEVALMNIQVVDNIRNIPMKWKVIKDSPYEKIIEIYFFQPLIPGEGFDIRWSCRWLGTFTRSEDYVFYPVNYYKRGVKKLIARIVLDKKPKYVELIKINGEKIELEPQRPKIREENEKCVITYEIDNPKFIYVIQFGRQDIISI
jgi:hypothetical protein